MQISLRQLLSQLPLPATATWPNGVWDKEAFAHGSMSLVLFVPRGTDYQSTHKRDELYIAVKGSGVLVIEEKPHPFAEGDALFVPAGVRHHFEDFTPDLITWAVFWGPEGGE